MFYRKLIYKKVVLPNIIFTNTQLSTANNQLILLQGQEPIPHNPYLLQTVHMNITDRSIVYTSYMFAYTVIC